MDVDNQPIRIRQQKSVVIGKVIDLEHDARASWGKLGYSNLLQKTVIHIKALANQGGRQFGTAKIEEDARRSSDACEENFTSLSTSMATRV